MQYVMLTYDIPTVISREVPSPVYTLRRIGFMANKSVCILPTHLLPVELIDSWKAHPEISYWVVDIGDRDEENIKKKAKQCMDQAMQNLHTSLIKNIAAADERLKEAIEVAKDNNGGVIDDTQSLALRKKRHSGVYGVLYNAEKELQDAIQFAMNFDLTDDLSDLYAGIKNALSAQWRLFNAQRDGDLKKKGKARKIGT